MFAKHIKCIEKFWEVRETKSSLAFYTEAEISYCYRVKHIYSTKWMLYLLVQLTEYIRVCDFLAWYELCK